MNFYVLGSRGEQSTTIKYEFLCYDTEGRTSRRSNFIFLVMCDQGANTPEIKIHIFGDVGSRANSTIMKIYKIAGAAPDAKSVFDNN